MKRNNVERLLTALSSRTNDERGAPVASILVRLSVVRSHNIAPKRAMRNPREGH